MVCDGNVPTPPTERIIPLQIGDHKLDMHDALELLQDYAVKFPDTVRFYDLAGDPDGRPGSGSHVNPADAVTLGDIGRLVAINAALSAEDVATLMDTDATTEFAAVPATARLEECVPGTGLYQAATALYDKFRLTNIGQAKRSKLLHLKRPWLVPIADTRVTAAFHDRARAWADELGIASGHWEAAREDLTTAASDFQSLTAKLSSHRDTRIERLGRVTSLRLLDILAWTLGEPDIELRSAARYAEE
jgi:Family of unknown function (DUF6308)